MKTTCWISMIISKESTTDKIDDALDELGDDFTEEEVRLVRIKFISEMAN